MELCVEILANCIGMEWNVKQMRTFLVCGALGLLRLVYEQ